MQALIGSVGNVCGVEYETCAWTTTRQKASEKQGYFDTSDSTWRLAEVLKIHVFGVYFSRTARL